MNVPCWQINLVLLVLLCLGVHIEASQIQRARIRGARIRVAVDGPAKAGKSTIARTVAGKLGYVYVDTGALYRAMTLHVVRLEIPFDDQVAVTTACSEAHIELLPATPWGAHVLLNGENVTIEIRTRPIAVQTPVIAKIESVRNLVNNKLRDIAATPGVIMDGRDIASVVMPDAELKVFMTAHVEARSRRVIAEAIRAGQGEVDFEKVLEEVMKRDEADLTRKVGALKIVDDAHVIDTTGRAVDDVIHQLEDLILRAEAEAMNAIVGHHELSDMATDSQRHKGAGDIDIENDQEDAVPIAVVESQRANDLPQVEEL